MVETLRDPTLKKRTAEAVQRRAAAPKKDADLAALEKQVATAETRVRNATEALVAVGDSQALVEAMKTEEQRLATLRAALTAAHAPRASKVAIHPRTIDKMLQGWPRTWRPTRRSADGAALHAEHLRQARGRRAAAGQRRLRRRRARRSRGTRIIK